MGKKKFITSCIRGAKEEKEEYSSLIKETKTAPSNVYSTAGQKVSSEGKVFIAGIINNILRKNVTLEDLKNLKELKKESKEFFLEDLKSLVHDEALHGLNQKIMEHALDLSPEQDKVFFLRESNSGIFRDLFYLEAKNNNWNINLDDNQKLTFDLPKWLLELYHTLIINFYEKNFEDIEFQKACYDKCYSWIITPFEKLNDEYKKVIKEYYINKSLAQSIMFLFISNFFKQDIVKNADINELSSLAKLEKEFNNPENVYIKKLEILNISSCLDYPTYNKVIPVESIEILGKSMTFSTLV